MINRGWAGRSRLAKRISDRGDGWTWDEGGVDSYDAFAHRTLLPWLENRKSRDLDVLALDLFSSGIFIDELIRRRLAMSGVSLGLKKNKNVISDVIEGRIQSNKTWRQLSVWLQEKNKSGFDLITCIPLGGYLTIPDTDLNFLKGMLDKTWQMTSGGGRMYLPIPSRLDASKRSKVDHFFMKDFSRIYSDSQFNATIENWGNSIIIDKAYKRKKNL